MFAKERHSVQILLLNVFAVFVLNISALWALECYDMIAEWRKFGVNAGVDVGYGEVLLRAFHLGVIRGAAILTATTGSLPALAILLIRRAKVVRGSIVIWWVFSALILTLFLYTSVFAS